MSQAEIVYLENYRGRRDARFRRAVALHTREKEQLRVLEHLRRGMELTGADRGAVVWLDEYGPGLAHPHAVLDLGADQPRRSFSPSLMRTAWNQAVPGLLDLPRIEGTWAGLDDDLASACVVALGSDGPRSWFLVLDSLTPRPAFSDEVAGTVMFLAGEVASVVLHQDLAQNRPAWNRTGTDTSAPDSDPYAPGAENPSFAGWPILKDMEEEGDDDEVSYRIRDRFLVARFIRALVEDHLVMDAESIAYQVAGIRREVAGASTGHPEERIWERILEAVETARLVDLSVALLDWGREVDGQGHLSGAVEILDLAFELAKATCVPEAAADAARFRGKVHRTRAEWEEAVGWYEVARAVAGHHGDRRKLAVVLDGLANAYRDLGKLPLAQESLEEVLEIGRALEDSYVQAIGHHDLMTVQKLRGNLVEAIQHGWKAVQAYDSRDGQLRALFDLASTLRESGEISAAWDAYSIVADQIDGKDGRILALDALAYVAALRGDEAQHDAMRSRMDEEGWEDVAPVYRGQILYYRGLSSRALGREEDAGIWLGKALAFAEGHDLNQLIFEAEAALENVPEQEMSKPQSPLIRDPVPEEILGVRQGLREMKEARAGLAGRV